MFKFEQSIHPTIKPLLLNHVKNDPTMTHLTHLNLIFFNYKYLIVKKSK